MRENCESTEIIEVVSSDYRVVAFKAIVVLHSTSTAKRGVSSLRGFIDGESCNPSKFSIACSFATSLPSALLGHFYIMVLRRLIQNIFLPSAEPVLRSFIYLSRLSGYRRTFLLHSRSYMN